MHYLDLNFGELDFDIPRNVVTARVFGAAEAPVLERTFLLMDLGVGGACRPVHGFLPPWRHALALVVWVLCLGLVVAAPLALAIGRATLPPPLVQYLDNKRGDGRRGRRDPDKRPPRPAQGLCAEQRVPVEMERDAHGQPSPSTIHVVALYEDFSPWDVTCAAAGRRGACRRLHKSAAARSGASACCGTTATGASGAACARVWMRAAETPGPRDAREPGPRVGFYVVGFVVSRARPLHGRARLPAPHDGHGDLRVLVRKTVT